MKIGEFGESFVKVKSGFALGLRTFLAVVLILCFVATAVFNLLQKKERRSGRLCSHAVLNLILRSKHKIKKGS